MGLNAGRLNRRVTIQVRSDPLDGYGDSRPTWTDVATVWAHVEPLSGKELAEAQVFVADASLNVTIRYRTDVSLTPKNRLLLGTRELAIVSVLDKDELHEQLLLLCSERVV